MIWLWCSTVLGLWISGADAGIATAESLLKDLPSSLPEGSNSVASYDTDNGLTTSPTHPEGDISSKPLWPLTLSRAVVKTPKDLSVRSQLLIAFEAERNSVNGYNQWREKGEHKCNHNSDCRQHLEDGYCILKDGRRACSCLGNYVRLGNTCLVKVLDGGVCNKSIQCVVKKSICSEGYCRCLYGYDSSCVYTKHKSGNQNVLLPVTIITLATAFSLALCAISGILLSKRFVGRAQSPFSRRTRTTSEVCARSIDKPPTYDEVTSTSASTLVLSIEGLNEMPPPSYDSLKQFQQPTTSVCN